MKILIPIICGTVIGFCAFTVGRISNTPNEPPPTQKIYLPPGWTAHRVPDGNEVIIQLELREEGK